MTSRKLPELDERLSTVVDLTPKCRLAADIGADHGHTACHLLQTGRCERMIVTDISPKALARAKAKLTLHGLERRASFHVADGLDFLEEPADAVLVTGMGAQTMVELLSRGRERLHGAALILQPNRAPERVREWLSEQGFAVADERIAHAAGRYYVILRASPGRPETDGRALFLGPCLLRERPPHFTEYFRWRLNVLKAEGPGVARLGEQAAREHEQRMRWMEEVLA
ncbi:MAG TPA: class I SAM-dependent methyltransferase [Clostridia bacterium]|nr:class I SAM-dependent methyltransferase [Clostridia bacterium]